MNRIISLLVKTEESNLRVDAFINNKEKSLSRTRIKNLILKKNLKLNNQILISPSKKVSTGDQLSLEIPDPKLAIKHISGFSPSTLNVSFISYSIQTFIFYSIQSFIFY